ncbi:MAG: UDP-N-acetylmuramoyl-L-alanyl-D-glutamate--2,6-diaminopimelate ligase [Pseudanabaenaceae cyanobacterium]
MELGKLLQAIAQTAPPDLEQVEVARLVTDSRQCGHRDLFIGMPGTRAHGADFAEQALQQGAVGAVLPASYRQKYDHPRLFFSADIVADCGRLAHAFYEYPTQSLQLIGVTGTNGKTTTTHLIEHLLYSDPLEYAPALLGTLYNRWRGYQSTAVHTTPFAIELQAELRQALDAGCKTVVMEVSSHALAQRRVWGCQFQVAVFTNLTQDHLDFHGTMENYFQAKALLFSPEFLQGQAVINWDDGYGKRLIEQLVRRRADLVTYSLHNPLADIYFATLEYSAQGFTGLMQTPVGQIEIFAPLVGQFNVSNVLAAVGAGLAMGLSLETIQERIAQFTGVAGRVERVAVGAEQDITVVVDYAHTPDSLGNILQALRPFTQNRLICVFGCGGDRDRTKRPAMGKIAQDLADLVYVTSDNPRTEDPQQILADILAGMVKTETVTVIPDRRECIYTAIQSAQQGDTVVIAGKGHEDYQILGTQKFHFDDREEARLALERKYG